MKSAVRIVGLPALFLMLATLMSAGCSSDTDDGTTGSDTTTDTGDTTGGDTSGADTTGGDTSGADTSGGDTTGADTTGGETTGGETTGGETTGADTTGDGTTTGGGADTGGPTEDDPVPPVELDVPASGFQMTSTGRWIKPGTDVEFCEVITVPGTPDDVYYVDHLEVAMHPWSHHVIIDAAEVGSATEAAMDDGASVPCYSAESTFGGELLDVIGAQQPYNQLKLPGDVGRIFYGGQKIVVDYHYFNPTTDLIPARHAINFHTVDEEEVNHVAQTFGFYNFGILTLPGQQASFAAECTFSDDVMLYALTRHTHRWGTDFHIWHKGGEQDGEHLWTSNSWELETDYVFDEPVFIPKGQGFSFQCEYDNTSDHALTFGIKATDEMCILFGIAWSPDGLTLPDQTCQATGIAAKDMP
ncbi:MAG: hypothetical protein ACI9WU_001754 [Myxococcota bacterium]|jgi:hypothetical protein